MESSENPLELVLSKLRETCAKLGITGEQIIIESFMANDVISIPITSDNQETIYGTVDEWLRSVGFENRTLDYSEVDDGPVNKYHYLGRYKFENQESRQDIDWEVW